MQMQTNIHEAEGEEGREIKGDPVEKDEEKDWMGAEAVERGEKEGVGDGGDGAMNEGETKDTGWGWARRGIGDIRLGECSCPEEVGVKVEEMGEKTFSSREERGESDREGDDGKENKEL